MRMLFVKRLIIVLFLMLYFEGNACTIVAVSGGITPDHRPLLYKNRDSSLGTLCIKYGVGLDYSYICQYSINYGYALAGYNEVGFAIINSDSYNMPNNTNAWNAYIMQQALGKCATVAEFEYLLDTITKPIAVASNYGVMDAYGNIAIIETNANTHVRYDADSTSCGYLIRTNFSFSEDTSGVWQTTPTSLPRYQIANAYLANALLNDSCITKEHLISLSRCLINNNGIDLRSMAPLDENDSTFFDFRYYVPRYSSTSAMVIQGVLPYESPNLTVAWTIVGPPLASVAVPYIITPQGSLPQKSRIRRGGHSWFSMTGQQLKNFYFVNNTTIDLSKLYNQAQTGILQKIVDIEENVLLRGNGLVDSLRMQMASSSSVADYYIWIDNYLDQQYCQSFIDICDVEGEVADTIYIHDTIFVEVPVIDTVNNNEYLHDTVYITEIDTCFIELSIHDTVFFADTLFVEVPVIDTVYNNEYLHDTVYITEIDTCFIEVSINDTVFFADTLYVYDTIYLYDTIYIEVNGVEKINTESIVLYQSEGHIVVENVSGGTLPQITVYDVAGERLFSGDADRMPRCCIYVPTSGIYIVKIGKRKMHKIAVVK